MSRDILSHPSRGNTNLASSKASRKVNEFCRSSPKMTDLSCSESKSSHCLLLEHNVVAFTWTVSRPISAVMKACAH